MEIQKHKIMWQRTIERLEIVSQHITGTSKPSVKETLWQNMAWGNVVQPVVEPNKITELLPFILKEQQKKVFVKPNWS